MFLTPLQGKSSPSPNKSPSPTKSYGLVVPPMELRWHYFELESFWSFGPFISIYVCVLRNNIYLSQPNRISQISARPPCNQQCCYNFLRCSGLQRKSIGIDFGLKTPPFQSPSLTMKENVFCIINQCITIDVILSRHLPHLMQVLKKITVSR